MALSRRRKKRERPKPEARMGRKRDRGKVKGGDGTERAGAGGEEVEIEEQLGVLEPWHQLGHGPHLTAHIHSSLTFHHLRVPRLLQLHLPISQMWGNGGPERRQCLPTLCPLPRPAPHLRWWWSSRPVLSGCVSSGHRLTLSGSCFLHPRKGVGMPLSCWAWLIGRKQGDNGSPRLAGKGLDVPFLLLPPSQALEGL